ncbi:MAG: Ion channel protein [Proteobacteria bacterium]|nr:Ion channel protein [Pseudomonadota bacterium]MBU1456391.1 Ion channel protein [Pseudomonadota bacterium]
MTARKKKPPIEGHAFRNLLFFLLLYIVGSPFLDPYPSLAIFAHASLSVAMFVAIYTVQKQQQERSVAIALLLPLLILYWLGIYDIISFSRLAAYLFFTVYFGLLVYSYVWQIAHSPSVTRNVLYATFSLYLIFGLFWGSVYAVLNELSPGAYSGILLENLPGNTLHTFNYFSFVTLTTLGYGDIIPQTAGASSLCQMEAIFGQFFTAVVVAWLVGMHVSSRHDAGHTKN